MLKKEDFIKAINYILTEREKEAKFDLALKDFAPSDFTGFWRDDSALVDWLANVMEDKYENIAWWVYDTDGGKLTDMCKITYGEPDDPDYKEWDIRTPSDLYDYLMEEYLENTDFQPTTNTTFDIGCKAQTEGVRFALNEIAKINKANEKTGNPGWENRKTLMTLLYNNIVNHYLQTTGLDATSLDELELFTKEESNG